MHSDWFNGIEILQSRWQHGEKVEYSYPSGLENTLCKWELYVPLVTKRLCIHFIHSAVCLNVRSKASSKASSPHSAIQSFLLQMRVSSPLLKFFQ
jgi:hypothetical protein